MSSWLSSTTTWLKKQYFNGTHYLQLLSNSNFSALDSDVYLFGIKFANNKQSKIQALCLYSSVLWFTYQENLDFNLGGLGSASSQGSMATLPKDDIGWGCMLRVGQMLLAQALRINKGEKWYGDQEWIKGLLWEFIDRKGKFCIQRLANIGKEILGKEIGQWYSSYDIAAVMKKAIKSSAGSQNPNFKEKFEMEIVITTGQFSLKSVYNQTKIASSSPNVLKTKPCLLIVICRLGFQSPEPELLSSLILILQTQKSCLGILGGRPGKAHYIFGTSQTSFFYLDPHCVKNPSSTLSSPLSPSSPSSLTPFLCNSPFSMPHSKIDCSLGICFYMKNFAQMLQCFEGLKKLKCDGLVFCHQEMMEVQGGIVQIGDEEDEYFQLL